MSEPAPSFRPLSAAAALRLLRCARHPEREAAAKCPSCGQPCCRECTNEHEGRLLCASCLARAIAAAAPKKAARRNLPLGRIALTALAFLGAWIAFHTLGGILANVPPEFHDATVWKKP